MGRSRSLAIALLAHRKKLAAYELTPEAERTWIVRGSCDYHRDCIRHLERFIREAETAKAQNT